MKAIISSLIFAFTFLTRLPVRPVLGSEFNEKTISRSVIFFPAVGLFYGIVLYFSAIFLRISGIQTDITALILLAIPYLMNRFLHFDGLCDVADAFLADKSSNERLEILKDSGVGSFAVGIAVILMIFKYLLLKGLLSSGMIQYLVIIPVISRSSMVVLAALSAYPREKGTAMHVVGNIPFQVFSASAVTCIMILSGAVFFMQDISLIRIFLSATAVIASVFIFRSISYRKINGVTGDVLGAMNEISEIIILMILTFK